MFEWEIHRKMASFPASHVWFPGDKRYISSSPTCLAFAGASGCQTGINTNHSQRSWPCKTSPKGAKNYEHGAWRCQTQQKSQQTTYRIKHEDGMNGGTTGREVTKLLRVCCQTVKRFLLALGCEAQLLSGEWPHHDTMWLQVCRHCTVLNCIVYYVFVCRYVCMYATNKQINK